MGLMNLVKWMVVVNKKILEILVTWRVFGGYGGSRKYGGLGLIW